MQKFCYMLCLSVVLLLAFKYFKYSVWIYIPTYRSSSETDNSFNKNQKHTRQVQPSTKQLLYMVQCKDCLSDYYMKADVLGSTKETFDVLVLSYKTKCQRSGLAHVTYITAPIKTTWTSGRNYLYRYMTQNVSTSYLYYIFIDEDLTLSNSDKILRSFHKRLDKQGETLLLQPESPWRKYENFLLTYQPAVGVADGLNHFNLLFQRRSSIIPTYIFPGMAVDAMFNAFHRDVINDLLPYDESFEKKTWWASQQVIQCQVFFRYFAHVVTFMPVFVNNTLHQSYPRGLVSLRESCSKEVELAPNFIRTSKLTGRILRYSIYRENSYFTYVLPPNSQIRKHAYFADDFPERHNTA